MECLINQYRQEILKIQNQNVSSERLVLFAVPCVKKLATERSGSEICLIFLFIFMCIIWWITDVYLLLSFRFLPSETWIHDIADIGVRVTRSLVLCVCFVDRCLSFCTFSFGDCVVCPSSIYGFWLPPFGIFILFLRKLLWSWDRYFI
jgi:hypothetical protein